MQVTDALHNLGACIKSSLLCTGTTQKPLISVQKPDHAARPIPFTMGSTGICAFFSHLPAGVTGISVFSAHLPVDRGQMPQIMTNAHGRPSRLRHINENLHFSHDNPNPPSPPKSFPGTKKTCRLKQACMPIMLIHDFPCRKNASYFVRSM